MNNNEIIKTIKSGGIVVMPTDTIYGMLVDAKQPAAVARLYTLRQRPADKPSIILISDISDLPSFAIDLSPQQVAVINKLWPGPVSIILGTLAFRVPANTELRQLLAQTGPLIAPSANIEGQPSATTIAEARHYFGDQVDLYVDGGKIENSPSTLIKLDEHGQIVTLRSPVVH